jgi:hypothetical protein
MNRLHKSSVRQFYSAKGALHRGSGCAIGDIIAEWVAFAMPPLAIAFGWLTVVEEKTYAAWMLDFILAFGFGINFPPARGLLLRSTQIRYRWPRGSSPCTA